MLIPFNRFKHTDASWKQLQRWYNTPLGNFVFDLEMVHIHSVLRHLAGYYAVQLSGAYQRNLLADSLLRYHFFGICSNKWLHHAENTFYYDGIHLPLKSESVDLVLLPHTLDISTQQHSILKEVARIVRGYGYVIILGFNPMSLWRIKQLMGFSKKNQYLSDSYFIHYKQLMDWLRMQNLNPVVFQPYFFVPPVNQANILQRLRFIEKIGERYWPIFTSGYLLLARKETTPVHPLFSMSAFDASFQGMAESSI